jgi:hypothetical protein
MGFQILLQSHSNKNIMALAQNRPVDQWNKIEYPEVDLHNYTI